MAGVIGGSVSPCRKPKNLAAYGLQLTGHRHAAAADTLGIRVPDEALPVVVGGINGASSGGAAASTLAAQAAARGEGAALRR